MAVTDGVLVTVPELKKRLGIFDSEEDQAVSDFILAAEARLQLYIGRRLIAAQSTETFDGNRQNIYLKNYPIDPASLVATDTTGHITEPDILITARTGRLRYGKGYHYWPQGNGRWTIVYTGGLSLDPDWALIHRPLLKASVMDWASALYENIDPSIKTQSLGGGFSKTLHADELPPRIEDMWFPYKRIM